MIEHRQWETRNRSVVEIVHEDSHQNQIYVKFIDHPRNDREFIGAIYPVSMKSFKATDAKLDLISPFRSEDDKLDTVIDLLKQILATLRR